MNKIEIVKTGFILYVNKYQTCVQFYEEIIGLEVLYKKELLTNFEFLGSYLMVEKAEESEQNEFGGQDRDRTCLRINVADVKEACKVLDSHFIPYEYHKLDWGEIAKFRDPDGNLIGFRSAKEHEVDVLEYKNK